MKKEIDELKKETKNWMQKALDLQTSGYGFGVAYGRPAALTERIAREERRAAEEVLEEAGDGLSKGPAEVGVVIEVGSAPSPDPNPALPQIPGPDPTPKTVEPPQASQPPQPRERKIVQPRKPQTVKLDEAVKIRQENTLLKESNAKLTTDNQKIIKSCNVIMRIHHDLNKTNKEQARTIAEQDADLERIRKQRAELAEHVEKSGAELNETKKELEELRKKMVEEAEAKVVASSVGSLQISKPLQASRPLEASTPLPHKRKAEDSATLQPPKAQKRGIEMSFPTCPPKPRAVVRAAEPEQTLQPAHIRQLASMRATWASIPTVGSCSLSVLLDSCLTMLVGRRALQGSRRLTKHVTLQTSKMPRGQPSLGGGRRRRRRGRRLLKI